MGQRQLQAAALEDVDHLATSESMTRRREVWAGRTQNQHAVTARVAGGRTGGSSDLERVQEGPLASEPRPGWTPARVPRLAWPTGPTAPHVPFRRAPGGSYADALRQVRQTIQRKKLKMEMSHGGVWVYSVFIQDAR